MRVINSLVLLGWFAVLAAGCGGGGGSSGSPPPPAPVPQYPNNVTRFTFTSGVAVTLTPRNLGGTADAWSLTPALPAGLTFNTMTGAITGTPSAPVAPATYTLTASNQGGSGTLQVTFGVQSVLLELGGPGVSSIALTSTHMLTEAGGGTQHWVLWDYPSGAIITQADACPPGVCSFGDVSAADHVELADALALVPNTALEFDVRSVTTGAVMAQLKSNAGFRWIHLAQDGSYVCAGNTQQLTVYSPSGATITTRAGDYSNAQALCLPGQVRIGNGPAGSSVIETVALPSGTSTVSAVFKGTFNTWFTDGNSFLSNVGTSVWVYSSAVVQLDFEMLPSSGGLGGAGSWFWTYDGATLTVYKVGASATPTATYAGTALAVSGTTLALDGPPLRIIDLSGAAPSETDYSPPLGVTTVSRFLMNSMPFAALSSSQWVIGSGSGAVVDGASLAGTPKYFGYGAIQAIAGSSTRLVISTGIGTTLVFNAADWSQQTTLPNAYAQLALSDDGNVLATRAIVAAPGGTDDSVTTIALPSGSVINTWPYTANTPPFATDITLSSSGNLLGQVITGPGATVSRQVTASSGGAVLWSDANAGSQPIRLSMDDTLIAVSSDAIPPSTAIYKNDAFSSAAAGASVTWLPNNDLVANQVPGQPASVIYDASGLLQQATPLVTRAAHVQVIGADSIYDPLNNRISSATTGDVTWSTATPIYGPGAVAGTRVVFVTDSQVVMQPY